MKFNFECSLWYNKDIVQNLESVFSIFSGSIFNPDLDSLIRLFTPVMFQVGDLDVPKSS